MKWIALVMLTAFSGSVSAQGSEPEGVAADEDGADAGKLTTSKLGQKLGLKTAQVLE